MVLVFVSMSMRIKLLRNQHGLSLEQLAQKSGLTKSYLSKVERGVANPSISASMRIAEALMVDVSDLFGTPDEEDMVCVVKGGEDLKIASGQSNDRAIDILASAMPDKRMQPFVLNPPPEFADGPQLHEHPGEEFLYVLEGQIEIEFPERVEQLEQGESVYFRAQIPHRIRRLRDTPASALVVISQN